MRTNSDGFKRSRWRRLWRNKSQNPYRACQNVKILLRNNRPQRGRGCRDAPIASTSLWKPLVRFLPTVSKALQFN